MVNEIEVSALIDGVIEFQLLVSKYDRICQIDNAPDDEMQNIMESDVDSSFWMTQDKRYERSILKYQAHYVLLIMQSLAVSQILCPVM